MTAREKILRLIKERRVSRAAAAEAAGVAYSTFMTYVDPKQPRLPRADTCVAIARFFGVPSDWLWDEGMEWPPPEQPALTSYSDMRIVEELARRRDLIRADMAIVDKRVGRDHLHTVEAIAQKKSAERSDKEVEILSDCLRDLNQLGSLESRLSWLDPDQVCRPMVRVYGPFSSIQGLTALQNEFERYRSRTGHEVSAYAASLADMRPNPGQILFHPGFGDVVSYDDAMLDANRRHPLSFVPLVEDLGLLPPTRRDDGRSSRELGDRMVCYISDDQSAFALKLPAESATDDCPAGTVIVCEPNKELNPIDRCVLVPSQSGGDLRIVTGEAILSERPEYRSAAERLRANAGVYPIVAAYKPGAGTVVNP